MRERINIVRFPNIRPDSLQCAAALRYISMEYEDLMDPQGKEFLKELSDLIIETEILHQV